MAPETTRSGQSVQDRAALLMQSKGAVGSTGKPQSLMEQEDEQRWRSTRTDAQIDDTRTWSCVACSLQQGMQASEEEEEREVRREPVHPATHPAFSILQHGSPRSPARQHPRDRSDGCVSQGWAWGQGDPAFCSSVSHRAKLPQPGSTGAPSIAALPLAHARRPARVCSP